MAFFVSTSHVIAVAREGRLQHSTGPQPKSSDQFKPATMRLALLSDSQGNLAAVVKMVWLRAESRAMIHHQP